MPEAGRNFGITVTETPTDDASRNPRRKPTEEKHGSSAKALKTLRILRSVAMPLKSKLGKSLARPLFA